MEDKNKPNLTQENRDKIKIDHSPFKDQFGFLSYQLPKEELNLFTPPTTYPDMFISEAEQQTYEKI